MTRDERCCDYDCHQGRNCPARVAKVGQRIPDAEPLPPSQWRRHVRHLARWLLICLSALWLAHIALLFA